VGAEATQFKDGKCWGIIMQDYPVFGNPHLEHFKLTASHRQMGTSLYLSSDPARIWFSVTMSTLTWRNVTYLGVLTGNTRLHYVL